MSYPVYMVPAGDVLPILFDTFDGGTGASVTMSGLAVTDIEIYKDGSTTQRASDAGYTLLDTDGIDFDSITGIHGFSIDTGDNTDASFYTVGSWFHVVVSAITVDAQTVSFIAAAFRIMAAEAVAGKPKVDVDAWLGTAAATPTVAGVPEVDITHFGGSAGTFASGVPAVNTTLIEGSDATNQIRDSVVDDATRIDASALNTASVTTIPAILDDTDLIDDGTSGLAKIATDVAAILVDTGTTLDGKINTIDGIVDDILLDTAEIGTAGAGLTNINLPNQTMDIVGSITGNLSGSVGSVTGAVGSVTGNVGGNVTGSVGSLATQAKADVNAEVVDALATDTYAEPGQGAPSATTTLAAKINYLYKAWRNKSEQTATEYTLYADDASTADQQASVSDDSTTFTRGEMGTGA